MNRFIFQFFRALESVLLAWNIVQLELNFPQDLCLRVAVMQIQILGALHLFPTAVDVYQYTSENLLMEQVRSEEDVVDKSKLHGLETDATWLAASAWMLLLSSQVSSSRSVWLVFFLFFCTVCVLEA
jgi:hypothetical protein